MRRYMPHWLMLSLALALLLPASAFAKAAKQYQVTGVVVSVSDTLLVIQKPDDEKWEIERTADLKVEGALKVGAKVTVHYHMIADSAEVKDAKGK